MHRFGLQCSLLAALYAGEDDNCMAGISLTLTPDLRALGKVKWDGACQASFCYSLSSN